MRAQNQQDLIYKRGQAGITKASVTIVFDNSDREKSPVGLEDYKQITVTRQVLLLISVDLTFTNQRARIDSTPQHIKILVEWPQVYSANGSESFSECSVEHQQSQFPDHAGSHN